MKSGRFCHKVEIEVELTGLDLVILEYHARQHYDGTCNRFFESPRERREPNHDGYTWLSDWQWAEWRSRHEDDPEAQYTKGTVHRPEQNLEFAAKVTVTSRALDLSMKILERLGANETWELVEKLTGRKMPQIEQSMGILARQLSSQIREASCRVQDEWVRLNETQKGTPDEAKAGLR